jgi:hypothetical protein
MSPALRSLLPTPDSLVSDGRFALGTYQAPFGARNPLLDHQTNLSKLG